MSPQERSLRAKAATVGVCIEAVTWLLLFWAMRISPENPEDTLPMWLFGATQFPSILLLFLLLPLIRFFGIPAYIVIGDDDVYSPSFLNRRVRVPLALPVAKTLTPDGLGLGLLPRAEVREPTVRVKSPLLRLRSGS